MDFFDAVKRRYSEKAGFRSEKIPDVDLELILDAGLRAPSGMNKKPIDFVVVREEARRRELAQVIGKDYLADAGCLLFVVADKSSEYYVEDAAAAMENILLAATALDYASCWIQPRVQNEGNQAKIKGILGIPAERFVFAVMPVGVPKKDGAQAEKKSIDDGVHFERW
jgi:nitroreductase